jgi:hypothetical protein
MFLGFIHTGLSKISALRKISYYFVIYVFFINLLLILTNVPYVWRNRHIPVGNVSVYMHQGVVMDYLGYINFIRQGKEIGTWSITDAYDTGQTTPTKLFLYFVLLGKIALIFRLTPTLTYHLARVIQFELFAGLVFAVCRKLLGNTFGFWAAVLSFIATPPAVIFGYVLYGRNNLGIPAWWMMNPFRRIDMLPHHSASAILLILEVLIVLKALKKPQLKLYVLAGLTAFFSTLFHPISAMVFGFAQPVAALIDAIAKLIRTHKFDLRCFGIIFIPFCCTGVAVLLVKYDVVHTYPFNMFLSFDVMWYDRYVNYVRDYLIGGGWTLLLGGPIAVWLIIKAKDMTWRVIAFWALISFTLIPFSDQLNIAKYRFSLLLPYLPLTILIVRQVRLFWKGRMNRILKYSVTGGILTLYLGLTFPSLVMMYQDWRSQMQVLEPGMYVSTDVERAVSYLANHAPANSRILSGEINGMMIPAYAPEITFVGQYGQTLFFEDKKSLVRAFYGGTYKPDEARIMLKGSSINYIFYSPEEQAWGAGPAVYGLPLQIWYKNATVTIYQVPEMW